MVSLSWYVGKVLLKIDAKRLGDYCEAIKLLLEEQCRFRPCRITLKTMLTVPRLQRHGRKACVPLFLCFIDL